MATELLLNRGQAVFATLPKSEAMSHYRLPDAARDPVRVAEAMLASVKAGRLQIGIFDDESEKGRFMGRKVAAADGTEVTLRGQCGIRIWGRLVFDSGGEAGGGASPDEAADEASDAA